LDIVASALTLSIYQADRFDNASGIGRHHQQSSGVIMNENQG